jgi:cation:H+ antiporter
MDYLLLTAGLATLLLSGDLLVRGGVSLARHFKVSTLVVGMTVVSLGTSAPELVVSLQAVFTGHSDLAVGTVIGSNISNIGLVLGLTVIIMPITVNSRSTYFDWPVMMGATILLFFFIQNRVLVHYEGIIFVLLLAAFLVYSITHSRRKEEKNSHKIPPPAYSLIISIAIVGVSSIGLRFGADWLVRGASGVARSFDISEYVISASVIAFGTSVPELATSMIAAFKKESDISIGNIIGSNLFNILGILGITAAIKNTDVNQQVVKFDIWYLGGISLLLFAMMLPARKAIIGRFKGSLLVLCYILYIIIVYSVKLG